VLNEEKQKEKLEKLAKEIEKAYEAEKKSYEVEKNAREELERLDKAKNQFLLLIQHHLRTPLTSIMGYSDLLLRGTYGKQSKKTIEVIKRFEVLTQGLIKMVNEFLDVTQFQLGKSVVFLKPGMEVVPILEKIVNELKFETEKKGVYLKLEKTKNIPAISADPVKLKAALFNIIDNAVKYTTKGGVSIKVLAKDNSKILIQIKDTGIGISKENLKTMFNRVFERGEEAKKTFVTGRGIGLYLANQIVKYHNGAIVVDSEGEGKGSTFNIELPISI